MTITRVVSTLLVPLGPDSEFADSTKVIFSSVSWEKWDYGNEMSRINKAPHFIPNLFSHFTLLYAPLILLLSLSSSSLHLQISCLFHLCTVVESMTSAVKPQVLKIENLCIPLLLHTNPEIRMVPLLFHLFGFSHSVIFPYQHIPSSPSYRSSPYHLFRTQYHLQLNLLHAVFYNFLYHRQPVYFFPIFPNVFPEARSTSAHF